MFSCCRYVRGVFVLVVEICSTVNIHFVQLDSSMYILFSIES